MKLGERIRELRVERGWRLRDLGESCDLHSAYVSQIELGSSLPSLEALNDIAKAFGISLRNLLTGVDFVGAATNGALAAGVAALKNDEQFGAQLTPDWAECLSRIEYRGKRLRTKTDALEIYLHLRRVLERGS